MLSAVMVFRILKPQSQIDVCRYTFITVDDTAFNSEGGRFHHSFHSVIKTGLFSIRQH